MKFPKPHTLKEIANLIGAEYVGLDDFPVLESVQKQNKIDTEKNIIILDHMNILYRVND